MPNTFLCPHCGKPISPDQMRKPQAPAKPLTRKVEAFDLSGAGGFNVGIVGESYRQDALRRLSGGRRERGESVTFLATLIAEPENTYDNNAVKICISGSGDMIGYLSRADSIAYGEVFKLISSCGRVGACKAKVIGGTKGKPSFGVMIDIRDPNGLLNDLMETLGQKSKTQ